MKKIMIAAFMFGLLSIFSIEAFSSGYTDCVGLCNRKQRDCKSEMKKRTFSEKGEYNAELRECEAEFKVCKASCFQTAK